MKTLYYIFAITTFIVHANSTVAQTFEKIRTNHWYFANGAALDFTCGSPVSVAGSNMTGSTEGSASISDMSGNLLMYTNGETVWDRNHNVMPNGTGLMGSISTVQTAVIIPHPGNSDRYFIFTAGTSIESSGTVGVRFSEVDMTLNAGNGDVLPGNKNTLLFAPNEEKLTAVRNAAGNGYWVIAQEKSSSTWHAYEVTAAGVNTTPVTTTVGPPARPDNSLGAKFSPDGSMLVSQNVCGVGVSSNANLTMYGFDNATGVLTYRWSDCGTPGFKLEFSPDNTKLYAAGFHCYQYDLSAGGGTGIGPDTVAVKASRTQLTTSSWEITGGMQLAPDCKIYFSKGGASGWIGVINDPNAAGIACNYTPNHMTLTSGSIGSSNRFPNFVQSFFEEPCDTNIGVTLTATDSSICAGQCVDLMATVNGICTYTLTWSPTSFSGNGPHTVCPTTTTTYQVIVNGGGVTDTSTVTINVGAAGVNAGNDLTLDLCNSDSPLDLFTSLTGSPDAGGTWSGPSSLGGGHLGNFDPASSSAGTYEYVVNGGTCGNDTAEVVITISSPVDAGGDYSIAVCGSTAPFDLLDSLQGTPDAGGTWSGPSALAGGDQGTFDPSSNAFGAYEYVVLGSGGCPNDTATITLTNNAAPDAGGDVNLDYCELDPIDNLFDNLGGTPDATGSWQGPSSLGGGHLGSFDPANDAAGTYQYIVSSASCGNDTADVVVSLSSPVDAGSDYTISLCAASAPFNLLDSLQGTPDNGGTWTGPSSLTGGDLGTFDPSTNAFGTYEYIVTSSGTCPNDTATVTIVNNNTPDAGTDATITYCELDGNDNLFDNLGGTPDATGNWDGPSMLAGGHLGTFDPGSNVAGTYYYIVGSASCGLDSAMVNITIDQQPSYTLADDTTICENVDITLTLPATYTYDWDNGSGSSNSYTILGTTAGSTTHYVNIDNGQCSVEDSIIVNVINCSSTLEAMIAGDTVICENECTEISAIVTTGTAPYTYLWSDGTLGSDMHTYCPSMTGQHFVVITDDLNNVDTVYFTIEVNPNPIVTAGNDTTISAGGTADLWANGADDYFWTPNQDLSCANCANTQANPLLTTTYIVTGSTNGCEATAFVVVTVEFDSTIFIPNAFSPNGDGLNDTFGPITTAMQTADFKVFDRWGKVVFETTDLSDKWDGTIEGADAMVGTYHYMLTGVMHNLETIELSGSVSLIK